MSDDELSLPNAPAVTEGGAFSAFPAPRSASDVAALAKAAFGRERGLSALGVAGFLIALLCLGAVMVRGPFIPPEGKMLDAATFTFGVGIFTLTMAVLLPLAGFSEPARRRWRRLSYIFVVYGFVLEPVQAFRGLDPRFPGVPSASNAGGLVDRIAGPIFGVTALLFTVLFVILALRFFRADVLDDSPAFRLGIRYGAVAVTLSFGVGIAMSALQGRVIGEVGNLLPAHALGVHGIQAVPLVALLLTWVETARRGTMWLHVAGIGWLSALAGTLVQALLGRPPLEPSILTALMVVGLALWVAVASYAFVAWRRTASDQSPPSSMPQP